MPQHSETERYLKGRSLQQRGPSITSILKKGDLRIVRLADRTKKVVSKQELTRILHRTLSEDGKRKAVRSLKTQPDGVTKVTLGGSQKGERRTYKTLAAAKSAITKHYGKF